MKKTHKTILLMAIGAVLMFMAVSCGVTKDTTVYDEGKFLFINIDKESTQTLFLWSAIVVAIYWFFRIIESKGLKDEIRVLEGRDESSITFEEVGNKLLETADIVMDSDKANDTVRGFYVIVRIAPALSLIFPILAFWSWIIHSRGVLYWVFCVVSFLAIWFLPKWLGFDNSKIVNLWFYLWSIITVIACLIMIFI